MKHWILSVISKIVGISLLRELCFFIVYTLVTRKIQIALIITKVFVIYLGMVILIK